MGCFLCILGSIYLHLLCCSWIKESSPLTTPKSLFSNNIKALMEMLCHYYHFHKLLSSSDAWLDLVINYCGFMVYYFALLLLKYLIGMLFKCILLLFLYESMSWVHETPTSLHRLQSLIILPPTHGRTSKFEEPSSCFGHRTHYSTWAT